MNDNYIFTIAIIFGILCLLLAIANGWMMHKLGWLKYHLREMSRQQLTTEDVFKSLLRLMTQDGIDVNKYLTMISQEKKGKGK